MRRGLLLTLLACSLPALALAGKPTGYKFTSFDVPGSTFTRGCDINNGGTIVGYFNDAAWSAHGFVYSGGMFTQFDEPDAGNVKYGQTMAGTLGQGINDLGTIVGRYDSPLQNNAHGYILSGGNFASFDVPGATFTAARGISPAGDVVGYSVDATGVAHGFVLSGGQLTTVDYPNTTYTLLSGMNKSGQIVGQYHDAAGNTHGFLLSGGRYSPVDFTKATFTQPIRINATGQIVGRYEATDGSWHGFLLSNGIYTTIDYPNAINTELYGITDLGELVGQWQDTAGHTHGFYAVKQ
jgi:probable HAF family extracellular repeat protein